MCIDIMQQVTMLVLTSVVKLPRLETDTTTTLINKRPDLTSYHAV